MHSPCSSTTNSAGSFKTFRWTLVGVFLMSVATPLWADVCVWRDPERTMQRIFPSARDYKTITVKMTADKIDAIEKALGAKLDDSEKREFNFYEVVGVSQGRPQKLGTVIALAGRAEYGTIEVVIGVDPNGRIIGAYIRRSRERVTRALESPQFLEQFKGKARNDALDVGTTIKSAGPDADAASRVVASVIRKMLVFREVLTAA